MAPDLSDPRLYSAATPCLLVDEDRLDANITAMANLADGRGLHLRPHVKTHKSLEIAARQVAAGASGITVATISEAEVFAAAGFEHLFIAYPLWLDRDKAARLRRVAEMSPLMAGVDSPAGVAQLAQATSGLNQRVSVLVEVDSGHARSGVPAAAAGAVAAAAVGAGLEVAGVFTFPGHSYALEGRRRAAADEVVALAEAVDALAGHGIEAQIVSGGSTPSAEFADASVLTEIRPGVYVFGDAQQWELGTCAAGDIALTVLSTVVSQAPDRVIADAGSKVLAGDRAMYATGYGRLLDAPDARVTALSEHHATITGLDCAPGTRVRLVPNHACVAVNLADNYLVSRGDQVVARWPVDARGCNQ